MPKAITRRRIDGITAPQVRRFSGSTSTGGPGGPSGGGPGGGGSGGGVTPGPTTPTALLGTFEGSGGAGTVITHETEAPLRGGDILLVGYAAEPGAFPSITPSLDTFTYPSTSAVLASVALFKIRREDTGITSFDVTISDGTVSYFGWILRGFATAFSTPEVTTTMDDALRFYSAVAPVDPDNPCNGEQGETVVDEYAFVTAPGPGSFTIYGACALAPACPDQPAQHLGGLDGMTECKGGYVSGGAGDPYSIGTVGNGFVGSGFLQPSATLAKHGCEVGGFLYSIAPVSL